MKRLVLCLLLASCSTPSVPPSQPVAPAVERVSGAVDAAGDAATEIRSLLSTAQASLSERRTEALAFKEEIERFRAEGMSKDEELSRVWAELNRQTQRNMFLEETLGEASEVVTSLEKALASARESVEHAVMVAKHKDSEAFALRESVDSLNAKLGRAEKNLATANVYKTWVLIVAGGIAALWILREVVPLVIRTFKPL